MQAWIQSAIRGLDGLGFAQAAAADAAKAEGAKMQAVFTAFVEEFLDRSTETATGAVLSD